MGKPRIWRNIRDPSGEGSVQGRAGTTAQRRATERGRATERTAWRGRTRGRRKRGKKRPSQTHNEEGHTAKRSLR